MRLSFLTLHEVIVSTACLGKDMYLPLFTNHTSQNKNKNKTILLKGKISPEIEGVKF